MNTARAAIALGLFTASCVTTSANVSSQDGAFTVQCKESGEVASKDLATIACEISNQSKSPAEFEVSKLVLPSNYAGRVASSQDIQRLEAAQNEDTDKSALFGLIVIAGTAVAGKGSGGGSALAGVTAIAAIPDHSSAGGSKENTTNQNTHYSHQHILGPTTQVAPQNSLTRSALITLNDSGLPPESIQLCFSRPTSECISAPIEPGAGRSRIRAR